MLAILEQIIAYVLLPGAFIGLIGLFVWMLFSVLRAKKQNLLIPTWKKAALIISASVLGTLILSVIALVIVFALAIAYM